jgi:Spy/CpxP family protein refolding chaperone
MFSDLQLTGAQKTQAHQIWQDFRTSAQPVRTQLQGIQQQLATAAKNGAADSQIDQLSNQAGALSGQLTAMRARAFGKFYNILTPDQKSKVDAKAGHFLMGRPGIHGGRAATNS